jgi:proteic killer suppression protein
MEIESIRHKSLEAFFTQGKAKGLPGSLVARIGKMLAFIAAAAEMDELDIPPNYGLHELKGDRAGEWAMTVSRNWRMTFSLTKNDALIDLDLEDYH